MTRTRLFIVIVACAASACRQPAESPTPAGAATRISVPAVGVYVTNEQSGDLTIIDAATGATTATVPLGKRPRGLAASPDRRFLYVALSGSPAAPPGVDESKLPPPDRSADGIGVVDLAQQVLLKVLPSGTDPEQVAVSHDGKQLYVANEDAALLSVVDVASGQVVQTFTVGVEPEGVSVDPGGRVWVTSENDGAVFVIDVAAKKVLKSVPVGPRPRSIAFLPDGSRAYVSSENGATLTVVDVRRLVPIKTVKLGNELRPMGIVASPDGRSVFVSTGRSKMVLFLDSASDTVTGSVEVGSRPWGIALSPDGRTLFTANGPSNDVSVGGRGDATGHQENSSGARTVGRRRRRAGG